MIQFDSYCYTPQGELESANFSLQGILPDWDGEPFQLSGEVQEKLQIPASYSRSEKLKGMRLKSGPFNFRYLLNLIERLSKEDRDTLNTLVCMQSFPTMTGYRNALRLGFDSNLQFSEEFFTDRLPDIASHIHPMAALMNMPNQLLCNLGIELDFEGESVNFAGSQSGLQALDWIYDSLTTERSDSILLAGAQCLQADWLSMLTESSVLPTEWASLIHFKSGGIYNWEYWKLSNDLSSFSDRLQSAELVLLDFVEPDELTVSSKAEFRPLIGQHGFLNPVSAMQTAALLLTLTSEQRGKFLRIEPQDQLDRIHVLGRYEDKFYLTVVSGEQA